MKLSWVVPLIVGVLLGLFFAPPLKPICIEIPFVTGDNPCP